MKKLIFLGSVLLLAFWILGLSVIKTSAVDNQSASQNYKVTSVEPLPLGGEESLTATPASESVDYSLVYPGILPDHFLYPVKMIRDRIWLWLTFNPLKKAEFMLLLADKRLGAAKALMEGNKSELGVSTLTKGEKYFLQAVAQERIAKAKGESTQAFLEKLNRAGQKHEEVLLDLQKKTESSFQAGVETSLGYIRQAQTQIKQALSQ